VGAEGKAISLACENFVYSLPAIEKLLGAGIPVKHADNSLFLRVQPRPHPREHVVSEGQPSSEARRRRRRRGRPGGAKPDGGSCLGRTRTAGGRAPAT
jgi:ATP-dependent RNA helicase RhlB